MFSFPPPCRFTKPARFCGKGSTVLGSEVQNVSIQTLAVSISIQEPWLVAERNHPAAKAAPLHRGELDVYAITAFTSEKTRL
jgi:hypothetical protein